MPSPKILFLLPYPPGHAPSQRFRVELFLPVLEAAGIPYRLQPFLDEATWQALYKGGSYFRKAAGVLRGFLRRWATVLGGARGYDYIFIHREAAPLGPPVFEWLLAKIWRKKIIYDFDDAIWIPNTSAANRWMGWAKAFWKVKRICRWSYRVAAGNEYLAEYARRYAKQVVRIPTVVDTEKGHSRIKEHGSQRPVAGWTGSHSTLPYLEPLVPVLQRLQEEMDFEFTVIADKDPQLPLRNYRFITWRAETENADLLQLDIGVMPLEADAWSEGKCGFKLIQYFAAGVPALASPVGVNKQIIEEGINGYLCRTEDDWESGLRLLLADPALRKKMGAAGREKVVKEYSLQSQREPFLNLFMKEG